MLSLTQEQVRWFCARRLGLAVSSLTSAPAVAARLLGAQAQVEWCAIHSLSSRMPALPLATDVADQL